MTPRGIFMCCSNCSKTLSDIAGICPYCGTAAYNSPVKASGFDSPDEALRMLNSRIEQNKRRREALPQDDRLLKIISDFEFKTEVVFKPAQTTRVYQAKHTYNPKPLYTSSHISPVVIILNIALTLLIPLVGFIRAIVIIIGNDKRKKNLGYVMLILSILLTLIWIFVIANIFYQPWT